MNTKSIQKQKIKRRIRRKIQGTPTRPRVSVFRSNKNIYVQCIDDVNGVTVASASSKDLKSDGDKSTIAKEVGKIVASKVKAAGFDSIVFDRGGNLYHGRVKSLADGIREGGLSF